MGLPFHDHHRVADGKLEHFPRFLIGAFGGNGLLDRINANVVFLFQFFVERGIVKLIVIRQTDAFRQIGDEIADRDAVQGADAL